MPDGPPDHELVRRSRGGDERAFEALVLRHQAKALNIAYRALGDLDAAHDVAQEAFVAAWRALPKFRGDAAFGTWLYRILYNLCVDHSKRRRKRGEVSLDSTDDDSAGPPEPADPGPEPDGALERTETQRVVQEAIARLPGHYSAILVMFDIEGLSYEDIAASLKLPMGTVKSRLNRARHALRTELAPLLEHGGAGHSHRGETGSKREGGPA